jgi:hypothetical protein
MAAVLLPLGSVRAAFTLQWTNNDQPGHETGFGIERSDAGGSFGRIATVGPTVTQYQDETASSTGSYAYRVNAFNAAGPSAYTNVVAVAGGAIVTAGTAGTSGAGGTSLSAAPPVSTGTTAGAGTSAPNAVGTGLTAPTFPLPPASQGVVAGATVVFNAPAAGSPAPSLQWQCNGAPIAGATGPRLVLTGVAARNAGAYTCTATNGSGTATSAAATLSLIATANVGRLTNLSVLNLAGSGQPLTLGFVVGGAGTTGAQSLIVRATGPALAAFGVSGFLPDPTLAVFQGASAVGANDNWGVSAANQAKVTAADAVAAAFPLTNPNSLDAALVATLATGAAYTVQIGANGLASGKTLAEIYDATPAGTFTAATPRLVNLSCRAQLAAGGSMIAGFIIEGASAKTVLIRATGPALAQLGIGGVMPDPVLDLHATVAGKDTVLAANAAWGGDPQITAVDSAVSAFALTDPSSHDAVILTTLPPGVYTAMTSSSSGTGGNILLEVYEVP